MTLGCGCGVRYYRHLITMEQVFTYQTVQGGVAVGYPSREALSTLTMEQIAEKGTPSGTTFYICDSASLPENYSFFDAWVFSTPPEVVVDLDKAKVIYKQTADYTAAALSGPLTQEYMRLTAIGGDTTAVQAQLRAINAAAEETAYLDATTVPELVACWPPELGPNPFLPVSSEVA
jgi:hypothetical protein